MRHADPKLLAILESLRGRGARPRLHSLRRERPSKLDVTEVTVEPGAARSTTLNVVALRRATPPDE